MIIGDDWLKDEGIVYVSLLWRKKNVLVMCSKKTKMKSPQKKKIYI